MQFIGEFSPFSTGCRGEAPACPRRGAVSEGGTPSDARRKPQENWLYRGTYGTRNLPKTFWLKTIFLHLPVRVRGRSPLRHRPPAFFVQGASPPAPLSGVAEETGFIHTAKQQFTYLPRLLPRETPSPPARRYPSRKKDASLSGRSRSFRDPSPPAE